MVIIILSNFGPVGYISKTWPKGLTTGLLAAKQMRNIIHGSSLTQKLWTAFTNVYLGEKMSWNSWNVKKFNFNKQNNFITLLMAITLSKKSSLFIPEGLRMRKTSKSVLCTNNNDFIATFVNYILGNWWCRSKKPTFCSQKLSGTNGFLYMHFLFFHCRQGFVNATLPTLHWVISRNFLQLLTRHTSCQKTAGTV